MKLTLSILKADVGSIGGHTKPSQRMMDKVISDSDEAVKRGLLIAAVAVRLIKSLIEGLKVNPMPFT